MGFPSPASDYVETRISLDQHLISQPANQPASQPASSDLLHAGIAFTFQGRNIPGGAACGRCVTYCLRWLTADMCNRRGVQDQAISDSSSTPPD